MKKPWFAALMLLGLWGVIAPALAEDPKPTCNGVCQNMRRIASESPYVVSIWADKPSDPSKQFRGGPSLGSGLLISIGEQLYTLTNNHVIAEPVLALRIWVKFHKQGFMEEVRVVGRDPAMDLALLTVPALPRGIRPAVFGNPVQIGDPVYALGYPSSIRNVSFGYVTTTETPHIWIATQAPISPGSSGGPLFNEKLEVVGINKAIIPGATISLVIPVEDIKRVLPRILNEGVVEHASAGFDYQNASSLLPTFFEQRGLRYPPPVDDVVVREVDPSSSASRAGVREGDAITHFNGVSVRDARELSRKIFFDYRPGQEVIFSVRRGQQTLERKITLGRVQ